MSYTTFSRQQLWNQFHQFPKETSIEAFEKVCFTLQVKPTNQLKKFVQNELALYKRKINPKKPTKDTPVVPNNYIVCEAVQLEPAKPATPADEQMDIDEPIDDDHPSSPNLRRPFNLLTPRSKRMRTEDMNNLLKQMVELEKSQFADSEMTVNSLLGYLLYRNNYSKDKEMAAVGAKVRSLILFNYFYQN